MNYLSATAADRARMLDAIGASSTDELFAHTLKDQWGWVYLIVGVLLIDASLGVLVRSQMSRRFGSWPVLC